MTKLHILKGEISMCFSIQFAWQWWILNVRGNDAFSLHDALLFPKTIEAAQREQKIYAVYREATITDYYSQVQKGKFWFGWPRRSGRPAVVDSDPIETLIKIIHVPTTGNITENIHVSHMSVVKHLKNTLIRESLRRLGASRLHGK